MACIECKKIADSRNIEEKREKKRARSLLYYLNNKEKLNEKNRVYAQTYPERRLAQSRNYRAKNKDKINSKALERHRRHRAAFEILKQLAPNRIEEILNGIH